MVLRSNAIKNKHAIKPNGYVEVVRIRPRNMAEKAEKLRIDAKLASLETRISALELRIRELESKKNGITRHP